MTKKKSTKKTTSLLWDEDLKIQMEKKAKENDRSLNGELIRAIKFYLNFADTRDTYIAAPDIKPAILEETKSIEEVTITIEEPDEEPDEYEENDLDFSDWSKF